MLLLIFGNFVANYFCIFYWYFEVNPQKQLLQGKIDLFDDAYNVSCRYTFERTGHLVLPQFQLSVPDELDVTLEGCVDRSWSHS